MKTILKGGTGTGKTERLIKEYKRLIEEEKIPSNEILVLLMNRNQSLAWRKKTDLLVSGKIKRTSFFGFVQEEITLFYSLLMQKCSDIKIHTVKPVFLTFEVSQYLLTKIIEQRRDFNGAFYNLTSKNSKIAIDISSNLVKAAASALPYNKIGERLYSSLEAKTEEKKVLFEEADKIISDYRKRCLECGVMDFAMAIDLYNNVLLKSKEYLESLKQRIKYLIVDNLEEAVPAEVDFIERIMPSLKGCLIAYNPEGGYGSIFGANRDYVESMLFDKCDVENIENGSHICDGYMMEFSDMLFESIVKKKDGSKKLNAKIKRFPETELRSDMLDNVAKHTEELISQGISPRDIVLISTFADPVTEYVLTSRLEKHGINLINISRKNRFIDNKFVHALITLGYLCHPDEKIIPNRDDVKALIMMILGIDSVRSSILAEIVCNQNPFAEFPEVNEEVIERIGYANVKRYELIRNWINDYRKKEPVEMSKFFQRVFVEILLVYGADEKDIINIKRLIDSAKKFSETVSRFNTIDVNKEFLKMIKNDVKSVESIFEMEENEDLDGVILATPMTYLANSLESKVMILVGLSSSNWLPRCVKELSNPYVLTKTWKDGDIYSERLEDENQRKNIAVILRALLKRCSMEFVTFESRYSADGYENDGILPSYF